MAFFRLFIYSLFLQLIVFNATAQNRIEPQIPEDFIVFHDSITSGKLEEIHLSSLVGGNFSPDDAPSFSSIELNDDSWYLVDQKLNYAEAIPDSLWRGFGWFRLKVKIDSSFSPNVTFQNYPGSGAVELFVNDSLILKRGNPALRADEQNLEPANFSVGKWYQFEPPKLTVTTIQKDNNVELMIEDNGPGISEEIKDKIMQPFFTTKKGTEGTGLGLSISNDIVKAHGGTLFTESDTGEGSIFKIILPLSAEKQQR